MSHFSACVGVASCSWCAYKEDGSLLDNPYCSTWDKCAFGIGPERQTDPPPVVHGGGDFHFQFLQMNSQHILIFFNT